MEVKSPFTLQGGAEDCSRVTAGESGLVSQSGGKSRDVSRVSAGSLGFHSSCHGDLRDPLVLPQESQFSFRIVRGSTGLLSNHFQGIGPLLAWRRESHGVSQVAVGRFGFVLSFNGDLREPLMLPQGSQVFQVASGTLVFLKICCRGIGPHLYLRWETHGTSPVSTWISGFHVEFHQGSQASTHVEV